MNNNKPRGYLTRLLALDCETSGLFFSGESPCHNSKTQQYYQAISWGFIVVDANTLNPIEELYMEIQWDGKSLWSDKAEAIHGLSKKYLSINGIPRCEAVEEIGNLILNHWGPDSPVCVLGHNPMFDLAFLRQDLKSEGLEVKFGGKMIDTNSIGFTVYNTYNSDDLFENVGVETRKDHNALDDARSALRVVQLTRQLADKCFGGD